MTETQAGAEATLVYDGSGMASVKEFTASGLVEDALYAFKVNTHCVCPIVRILAERYYDTAVRGGSTTRFRPNKGNYTVIAHGLHEPEKA